MERGPGKAAKPPVETQEVSIPGGGADGLRQHLGARPAACRRRPRPSCGGSCRSGPGAYKVHYAFAAGLAGNAKARLASGGPATGSFGVLIAPEPPAKHVDPKTGQVVPGAYPPPASTP